MKKRGLLLAALAAAMAVGAAMTSQAAGWVQRNGTWVYEDSNNSLVTNEWKRGADNLWRYLDWSGKMAVNTWVEDQFYVDQNGVMVSKTWLQLDQDVNGETDESHWYYFQDNGKAVMDAWKKIDGRYYHFNEEGAMETGWIEDNMYFCGESGAARTGWQLLYPPEDEDDYWEDSYSPFDDLEGKRWYYFSATGKKYVPSDDSDSDYVERRINGVYYCFNRNGAMQTGWVYMGSDDAEDDESIANYHFYGPDGGMITGFYSAEPPEDLYSDYENTVEWFYFTKSGAPIVGPKEGEAYTSDFLTVNGKTYLFNEKGTPVGGLQKVKLGNRESDTAEEADWTTYYFYPNDRTAAKGKVEVEEADGTEATYYFGTTGKGYTGVYGGYLYFKGKLQKAEEGSRYQPIQVLGKTYLVNASGRVTKSTSGVKDVDGTKYATDKNGILKSVDGEPAGDGWGREPDYPYFDY